MNRIHRFSVIAAAIASSAMLAAPAFAQGTTATTGGSTMSSGPGVNSSIPGGASSAMTPDRTDSNNTHLRADCFDRTTNVWRTTGDCAMPATGTAGAGTLNSSGSLSTSNSAPGGTSAAGSSGTSGTASGTLGSSSSTGSTGNTGSTGSTGSTR